MTPADLLALLVALPLLAAVLPLLVARVRDGLARAVTLAALLAQVALAIAVAAVVATDGPLATVVGDIPAAFGIGLAVDELSAVVVVLVAVVGVAAFALADADTTGPEGSLWLLLVAGFTGVAVTADVFNLYVFLEISGLAAYALVASGRGVDAAVAAFKYLLVGTVGATLYLLGVGYAFVATGTLSMADLAPALAAAGYDSTLVVTAYALVAVGLGVKLALFPLHAWKPDAYAAAPGAVAVALGALGSTVAGYALVRITYGVFTADFLAAVPAVQSLMVAAGAVSVAAGGVLALRATDVRRLLAYSSVSQFGLFAVGIALAHPVALTGALVALVGHAVAKGGLFAAAVAVEARTGARTVSEYARLAASLPLAAAVVAVLAASLVGLPPTVGFAGKWYLALGAVEAGAWVAAAVVVASTLLSLGYAGRLVERAYLAPEPADDAVATDGGTAVVVGSDAEDSRTTTALAVAVAAAVVVLALGVGAGALADWLAPVVEGWL
ncbi:proton-conducting transporter membrane subunit [Halorubellus litoreus]|uniref:Proton-conducting transporter membrane subunit n=1 Tax=Halorubellus litoreus TaxID=755308 RepID=A0ABD5VGL4_9EURY